MTTAVIGATGRAGSEIVRGVLARGDAIGCPGTTAFQMFRPRIGIVSNRTARFRRVGS